MARKMSGEAAPILRRRAENGGWIGLDWSLDQGNLIGANIAPEGGEWGLDWTGGWGLDYLTAWLGECSVSLPCAFCPVATPLPPPILRRAPPCFF
jgi:hypothetical protein